MKRRYIFCISHCFIVPSNINIVPWGVLSTCEGVVGIWLARIEHPVLIAMEGEVQDTGREVI